MSTTKRQGSRAEDTKHGADGDGGSNDGMLEAVACHENCVLAGLGCDIDTHRGGDNDLNSGVATDTSPPASHGWLTQVYFIPGW
jgi:hypothetical protein